MSSKKTVTNSSDEAQIKEAERQEKDEAEDLRAILQTVRGRRWIYNHIFVTCHASWKSIVFGCAFNTAFNEGVRDVGRSLLEEIMEKHFDLYVKMLKENHDHE